MVTELHLQQRQPWLLPMTALPVEAALHAHAVHALTGSEGPPSSFRTLPRLTAGCDAYAHPTADDVDTDSILCQQ